MEKRSVCSRGQGNFTLAMEYYLTGDLHARATTGILCLIYQAEKLCG